MRTRKVKLILELMGFRMPLGELKVTKFADIRKQETELICPECGKKPTWKGEYSCECGRAYSHFSKLKTILKATKEALVKPKLTQSEEVTEAKVSIMSLDEFSEYCDATADEYGIVVGDQTSGINLKKLLIATKLLNKVIVLKFNDTYEQRIAILTTSVSNRVILKEIIPLNLADIKDTMTINLSDVSQEELAGAKALIAQIPHAEEQDLTVDDYRTLGLEKPTTISSKVMQLEEVLARITA